MPDVAKLKKKAAELELKKQFDKALAVYVEILDTLRPVARGAGCLAFQPGWGSLPAAGQRRATPSTTTSRRSTGTAKQGFFNNAIALCNKILRHSPGRASVYYKLGKISAQKGFKDDAKVNFLEYADRMQKGGQGRRGLSCTEGVRGSLSRPGRNPPHARRPAAPSGSQDRGDRAVADALRRATLRRAGTRRPQATVERMKAIDPNVEPRPPAPCPRAERRVTWSSST